MRNFSIWGSAILLIAMVVGPLFSPPGFSWIEHTTSQQAGQMMPGAFIMRIGFFAFGLGVLLQARERARRGSYADWPFVVFGAFMILAAVFSLRSIDPNAPYDPTDDLLHSIFATAMGFAYGFGVGWRMLSMRAPLSLIVSAIAAASSIVLPLMMWQLPDFAGLLQRLMFIISFIWFGFYLSTASAVSARKA